MSIIRNQLKSEVFYIGGSPCSGKSTIAQMIADEFNLYYFKVDDFLYDYINKGKLMGKRICTKQSIMTPEETWMRDPQMQSTEELQFYLEIFEFVMEDLSKIYSNHRVIAEGAAFLPELMQEIGVDKSHYINITPTFDFQYANYKERPWVWDVLKDCTDKEKAFDNWMKRDALFAEQVRAQAHELGYNTLLIDGTTSCDKVFHIVRNAFTLE